MSFGHKDNENPTSSSYSLTHLQYRPDIDGLRAVAIFLVVGYHAFPHWLKGGLIGVDIFFVISGFLISNILFKSLKRGSFSFIEFYSRRIRRIFPALIVVLIVSYILGWLVLLADEYKLLGKHIVGSVIFLLNFILWQEKGYFDAASEINPLLHLWSLSIEEQFYILWPLVLWIAWKIKLHWLVLSLVIIVISFGLNMSGVQTNIVAAFYSPYTRFWELLIGSALAYMMLYGPLFKFADVTLRHVVSFAGGIYIVVGLLFISKETNFPGIWALLPTLGTALIIFAGSQAWMNRIILSNRLFVWLGLISYPLYLWHWPLLVFARIMEGDIPSEKLRIATIFISIALAWLTYRFIEKPIQFNSYDRIKTLTLLFLMVAVGYVGYYTWKNHGLSFRLKDRSEYSNYFENSRPEMKYFEAIELFKKWNIACSFSDGETYRYYKDTKVPRKEIAKHCYLRDPHFKKSVFIWGDSHAEQLYPGLKDNLPADWQILQVATSGCSPNLTSQGPSSTDRCEQTNWFALEAIMKAKPDVVIVALASGHDIALFDAIYEKLKGFGVKKVIFNGPTPHWTVYLPKIIQNKLWVNTPPRTYVGINKNILAKNMALKNNFVASESKVYADLISVLCNQEGCLTYIGDDKKTGITSWDICHLTPIASNYIAKNLLVDLIISVNTRQ